MMLTKILGAVAVAALALMAFAGTASATTLEKGGVKQSSVLTIEASLKSGTSALLSDTFGFFGNTCTVSSLQANTSIVASGATVSGPITALSWSSCKEGNPTVDTLGSLSIENIAGTTNGTVRWIGAKVTWPSAFGLLTCTTPGSPGTDMGTLTGVASGNATLDFATVLNCGITARYAGTYTLTGTNAALGVTG